MHIQFAPEEEQYIKECVENGYCSSEAEVVRYAIRLAREQMEAKRRDLLTALQVGEDDIAAGRVIPYTKELFKQIMQKAILHAGKGEALKSDVIP